ncbi:hypothetical protein BDD14_3822 [Edaphobacter modestus]|uniref:Uncharacterized protein n=1 Tax=Edaphobacter modestus TaxID=388466 RepID=A0A4V2G4U2_9BACT|nr:hypothetical protein BDD14_3822 [Edaphobacter modestus]
MGAKPRYQTVEVADFRIVRYQRYMLAWEDAAFARGV